LPWQYLLLDYSLARTCDLSYTLARLAPYSSSVVNACDAGILPHSSRYICSICPWEWL
jgi:hypothetical protein